MADYHAVLQRTLSGFSSPKPQLRTKLYERARTTIARQLESRNPPLTGDALNAELDKLERAITAIEQDYDPDYQNPVAPEVSPQPDPPMIPAAEPESGLGTPPLESAPLEQEESPPEADPAHPVLEELAIPPAPEETPEPGPFIPPIIEEPELQEPQQLPPFEPEPVQEVVIEIPQSPQVLETEQIEQGEPVPLTNDPYESEAAPAEVSDDAMDQWAQEFMAAQSDPVAEPDLPPANPLPDLSAFQEPAIESPQTTHDAAPDPTIHQPQDLDAAAGQTYDETLAIPPAPGFGENQSRRPKSRGILKWLLVLLLLAVLSGLAAYGWTNKEMVLDKLGLSEYLDDPTRPKPVKTISITPEPEQPEPSESVQATPKAENRLGENGEETTPVVPQPTITPTPTLPPVQPEAANTGGLLVAQNAILYEEGAQASENTVDSGRVVWSVVQEAPATGEPTEPAIRGRIEIPSRNVVLIMTIKRNADRALPASHLIELVFAVPDDFSGGAVGQINRFVLKESEQGRGEGIVAVPARIADGIFLIALNNLEEAKTKNESLLQSRDWIDIPMQYRTGRRALMTIEKGVPGEKVFKEVFAAWAEL